MDINVTGAKVYCYLFGVYPLTQTIVNTWIVMAIIVCACIFLTRNLQVRATSKRQIVAEYLVGMVDHLVEFNMGKKWKPYVPLIAAIFTMSCVSSLIGLTGAYSPTYDLNTFLSWSVLVFVLITYYKIKTNGFGGYLKGFTQPIPVMLPLNIISEVATPISMAFRHFGNITSGYVIGLLLYAALGGLSQMVFGWLPAGLGAIPVLQVGIPAVLNVYFGLFSSLVQPYIFCMLTMLFVSQAADTGEDA